MLGLTLVTAITATVVVTPGTVAADQVSDLKAQAAQIAQDLVLEQLQIGADQQEYEVDGAKVQQDQAEIGSTQDQIQSDALRVSRDRKRLQAEAVSAYVNMDPSDGVLFEGNQSDAFAKAEYEDVTSGDTELTINALHTDENGLSAERATLEPARGAGPGDHQPGGNPGQRGASDTGRAQCQAVRDHRSARGGRVAAAGGAGRSRRQSRPGRAGRRGCRRAHPHDGERSSVEHGANCACHHRRRGAGGRRRLVVRRPRCSLPSSSASCGSSRAETTRPCPRGARTWAASNSASPHGTKRPNWPACHNSSTSPRTRRPRQSRTTWPLRCTRPTVNSLGTTPAGEVDPLSCADVRTPSFLREAPVRHRCRTACHVSPTLRRVTLIRPSIPSLGSPLPA